MTRHPRPLLSLSVPAAVRQLLLGLIAEASRATERMEKRDPEALHDFRVALRRLRTLLRAYSELDFAPRKMRRRLRDLAHATNEARDLEVAAENLQRYALEGIAVAQPFDTRLAERLSRVHRDTAVAVRKTWPKLAVQLHRSLITNECDDATPSFAVATAALLEQGQHDLRGALEELRGEWRDETAHCARLMGKRLRYLAEPAAEEIDSAEAVIQALKQFQDRLGRFHDIEVLLALVAEAAADHAASVARAQVLDGSGPAENDTGYQNLAERLRLERRQIVAEFRRGYLNDPSPLLGVITDMIKELRKRTSAHTAPALLAGSL